MTPLIKNIILAVIIGIVVWLVLSYLLGPLLVSLKLAPATIVGDFFISWGYVIGILVGLWYFLTGGTWTGRRVV